MREEEVNWEEKSSGTAGAGAADPEIGPTDVIDELLQFTDAVIQKFFMNVLVTVAGRVEAGSLPDMKFMVEFARRLREMKRLPQEEYESFAAVLWREYQALEAGEQGKTLVVSG
jgi:hypothetical protein